MATNSERELLEELRAFIMELEAYRGEEIIDRLHDFLNRVHGAVTGRMIIADRKATVDAQMLAYIDQKVREGAKNQFWQNRKSVLSSQLSEADKQALMQMTPGAVIHTPPPSKTVTLEGQFSVPVMEKRFMDEAKIHAIKSTIRALTDEMLKQGIIKIEPVSSDTARGAEIYRVRVEMVKP